MSTWAIIVIALCVCVMVNSFFQLIKDIVVAKHVADNLAMLAAICETEEDEEEEVEE
jgi:hypothetical protein